MATIQTDDARERARLIEEGGTELASLKQPWGATVWTIEVPDAAAPVEEEPEAPAPEPEPEPEPEAAKDDDEGEPGRSRRRRRRN